MENEKVNNKEKKGARITAIIIFVILVLAAITAFQLVKTYLNKKAALQTSAAPGETQPAQPAQQAGSGARNAAAVRVVAVGLGTIENTVTLGAEALADSQVPAYPDIAGKLTSVRVNAGDRVARGQILAFIDPSKPGDNFQASPVYAPVAGTVLSVPVAAGDTVQTGTAIVLLGDIGTLKLEAFVPERYSVNMRIGLEAQVSFEALPGEKFAAAIYEMSPVIDPASRTRRILLRFSGRRDERIMAGMFANIDLVTNSRIDAPVIPRACIVNTYGTWIVFRVDSPPEEGGIARVKRVEIETGLENEEMVEIVGGLMPGDTVVSEGQTFLSDGDEVRILGSK